MSFSHFAFNSVGDEFVITENFLLLVLNRNAACGIVYKGFATHYHLLCQQVLVGNDMRLIAKL